MKATINREDFVKLFDEYDRSENFSKLGRRKLFDYLEQLGEETGEDFEVDVIAICCDFSESSIEQALKDYNLESLDDLKDQTTVIEVDDETIIYQSF